MSKAGPLTKADWDAIRAKHAAMTPKEARAWLRKVIGRPSVTLEGLEREQVLMMLHLKEPFKETNNQHSWTSYYMIGDIEYHVTSFPNCTEPVIDKMLPEEEE